MKKKVNIKVEFPIYTIFPPIVGDVKNMEMSTGDIAKCIYRRALVDEILDDGNVVRLDLSNYDKDNSKSEKKRKEDTDEEVAQKTKEKAALESTEKNTVQVERGATGPAGPTGTKGPKVEQH